MFLALSDGLASVVPYLLTKWFETQNRDHSKTTYVNKKAHYWSAQCSSDSFRNLEFRAYKFFDRYFSILSCWKDLFSQLKKSKQILRNISWNILAFSIRIEGYIWIFLLFSLSNKNPFWRDVVKANQDAYIQDW